MFRRLRNSEGGPATHVRVLAAVLIVALTLSALVIGFNLLLPVLRWLLPALF